MQNLQLPTLNANTAATPAAATKPARSNNDSFQRSLAREMDARQASRNQEATRAQERQAANRNASANNPKPAEKARPAPQAERATESSAPPRRETASAPTNASQDAQASAAASNDASASQADEATPDGEQAEARSGDAVADMLALVAALNQPASAADGTPGATTDTAVTDAVLAGGGKSGAAALGNAVDAATLASLTQAEAQAADNTGVADVQAMSARLNAADFKAALGRAAAAALPAQNAAEAAAVTAQTLAGDDASATEGILPTTGNADSAGAAHGKQSAAGAAAANAAATPAEGRSKADDLTGGLSLRELATQPRQQESTALRTRAEAEALQASKDAAATAATDAATATTSAATAPAAALDASRAAGVVPTDKLYSRVGTAAWDQQLGQKVIFMAAGGDQSATLELNPPDLGPLQVVLSVSKDQATAAFTSAAPEVREALENALPRLREMMGEAGIQLGNATVSAGNPGQQDGQLAGGQHGAGNARGVRGLAGADGSDRADAAPRTVTVRRLADGAVDTFA